MDAFARRRGIPPADYTDGIDKQALVPGRAHVIEPIGTAPGLIVPWGGYDRGRAPRPALRARADVADRRGASWMTALRGGERLERSLLRVFGVSESVVAHAFDEAGGDGAGTTTTICAALGGRDPRAGAGERARRAAPARRRHARPPAARPLLRGRATRSRSCVLDAARARGATIATAESCTAGLVAARLTDVAGSSDVVLGGIVAYANDIKHALLGVPGTLLERHGAVSAECAEAMARGRSRPRAPAWPSRRPVSQGPGAGSEEKPVGLVYLHCVTPFGEVARRAVFPGDRAGVRDSASTTALHMVLSLLR